MGIFYISKKRITHLIYSKVHNNFGIQTLCLIIGTILIWGLFDLVSNAGSLSKFVDFSRYNQSNPVCKDCNILLISLDTLSSKHLPCYGYERNTAPGLCDFGKKYIRFDLSYAQSHWTLPSHISIFTSLYPSSHNMLYEYIDVLNPSYQTITEILKLNGYETQYFGTTQATPLPFGKGLERGFDRLYNQANSTNKEWEKAIDSFIKSSKKRKTFQFIHTYFLHSPYFIENKRSLRYTTEQHPEIPSNKEIIFSDTSMMRNFFDFFKKKVQEDILPQKKDKRVLSIFSSFVQESDLTKKKYYYQLLNDIDPDFSVDSEFIESTFYEKYSEYAKSLYDEKIFDLDAIVSPLLSRVVNEVGENTIIIVTSDHGEAFLEHGTLLHLNLYAEIQKVPLFIYIPGQSQRIIQNPIQGIDIFPTLLDLLNIKYDSSKIEGKSVVKCMIGNCFFKNKHDYIISESYYSGRHISLVDNKWKFYIHNTDAVDNASKKIELFDAVTDPWDTENIASKNPQIVEDQLKRIQSFINRTAPLISLTPMPTRTYDDIEKERREKLNYFHY